MMYNNNMNNTTITRIVSQTDNRNLITCRKNTKSSKIKILKKLSANVDK